MSIIDVLSVNRVMHILVIYASETSREKIFSDEGLPAFTHILTSSQLDNDRDTFSEYTYREQT